MNSLVDTKKSATAPGAANCDWEQTMPLGMFSTFDTQWCQLVTAFRSLGGTDPMQQFLGEMTLKIFGTMGLRSYDGTPHAQTMARWQQAKSMPH